MKLGDFDLTETGLKVRGLPPITAWESPLLFAIWAQKHSPWWIGDLVVFAEARFGDDFYSLLEFSSGVSTGMIDRYAAVARKVPPSRRRKELSWTHHREVANLPPKEADEILDKACREGLTSIDVREMVKKRRKK